MARNIVIPEHIGPILGAIRSVPVPAKPGSAPVSAPAVPFITISRQPGAGAVTLATLFVDSINQEVPEDQKWTFWDRELIEKVAADLKLSARLIDSLGSERRTWFSDFLESLSLSDDRQLAGEAKIYHRVTKTIRAAAEAGRVVIVGRGSVFITRKMPGGIHVRLVAPFEHRVAFIAREFNLPHDKAAARVKEIEHLRLALYRRYWPGETMNAEAFSLTINTAEVEPAAMIQMLKTLVHSREPVSAAHGG